MYCKNYFNSMLLYISTILHLKVHGIRIHRYSDRDSLSSGISKKDCSKIRCGNDTESWEVDPQNDHEDQGWWWHLALKTIHTKKSFSKKIMLLHHWIRPVPINLHYMNMYKYVELLATVLFREYFIFRFRI